MTLFKYDVFVGHSRLKLKLESFGPRVFKEKYPGTCVHFALINIVGIDLATSGAACFLLTAAK